MKTHNAFGRPREARRRTGSSLVVHDNLFLNNKNDDGVPTRIQPSMSTIPFTSAFFTQFARFVFYSVFFSFSLLPSYALFLRLGFRPSASLSLFLPLSHSLSHIPPPSRSHRFSSVGGCCWNYTGPSEFALSKWAAAAAATAEVVRQSVVDDGSITIFYIMSLSIHIVIITTITSSSSSLFYCRWLLF